MNTQDYHFDYNSISFSLTDKDSFEEREFHAYHELLYLLSGEVSLLTEQFRLQPAPESLIFIPAGCYHFYRVEKKTPFLRLKIGFPPQICDVPFPASPRIWSPPGSTAHFLLHSICSTLKENRNPLSAYGAFFMLLAESAQTEEHFAVHSRDKAHLIPKCLDTIHNSLRTHLTSEELAKALCVSVSTLTHTFRQELGISLHQYITEKRMMHASKLLSQGHLPTKIYAECGFSDYSSFYKAYKKTFGEAPSGKG